MKNTILIRNDHARRRTLEGETTMTAQTGSCLCDSVRFEITGPMRDVGFCHCEQRRRTSGHYVAASPCAPDDLSFSKQETLAWFSSSSKADRGFCRTCGSSLFWRPVHGRSISIMAGSLDRPTGLKADVHIHVPLAHDYYTIDDGPPQHREPA